jgi:hypothetical protein
MTEKRQANPKVHEALNSDAWTEAEKCVIRWQYNHYGHFYSRLFEAIKSADYINIQRLRLGFPDEVEGFLQWREGDLGQKIDDEIGL